jgi:UDP-N-acetylglucosamine 4-epimerase
MQDFKQNSILLTGGAGFIGSNLVEAFLQNSTINKIRVLDNLSTGFFKNLKPFLSNPRFEFIEGDIRNPLDCENAVKGMQLLCHQAALGSVPRSINDPLTSYDVNVSGFLNILNAARLEGIKRVVYASSSSVYGNLVESPKVEKTVGKVLSPYAATKMANELFAEAYSRNYEMTIVGLRYFNVFGPNQDPNGPYAAVVPKFFDAALKGESPIINGDGTITRDFTPVSNVVQINQKGLTEPLEIGTHYVLNVACGQTTDLNTIWNTIKEITESKSEAIHGPNRKGDILFSLADINQAKNILGYEPDSDIQNNLKNCVKYYRSLL